MKENKSNIIKIAVLIIILVGGSYINGFISHKYKIFPYKLISSFFEENSNADSPKQMTSTAPTKRFVPVTKKKIQENIKKLSAIGYLQGYQDAPDKANITIYEQDAAYKGVNFYVSGHAPVAILMDMNGQELHRWEYSLEKIWPDYYPYLLKQVGENLINFPYYYGQYRKFWFRARLFKNGDVVANFMDHALIKIDWNSRLLWAVKGRFHHDFYVTSEGYIYALTRHTKINERIDKNKPIIEDFIAVLDPNRNLVKEVSIVDCFLDSDYASILLNNDLNRDVVHSNKIEVLDGSLTRKNQAFKKGNVLVSLRHISTVAVINIEEKKVKWAVNGFFHYQHASTFLKSANILLFDNRGENTVSKVIEFDPSTNQVMWAYRGNKENGFFSVSNGANQRLPNGNTLIVESNVGRAFEVTKNNRVVWEFYNPHRTGENKEKIATIYDLIRYPLDYLKW